MAFVFRGDVVDEDTKMRAMQRLYLLLPNHKCPSKDCPFHPPAEEETKEEEDLPTEIIFKPPQTASGVEEGVMVVAPSPPETEAEEDYPREITREESLLSDHDSVLTGDSGVGRERDDFSDGEVVVVPKPVSPEPLPPSPQLQYIEEDEEVDTLTPESSTLGEPSDDDRATPDVIFAPPEEEKEEEIKKDAPRDRDIPDYTPLQLPGPEPTQSSDFKLQVAPEFTAKLKSKRVPEGLSLRLHCSVSGLPKPRVRWLKDRQEIHDGVDYDIENKYGLLTLEVVKVDSRHGGIYTCEACNEHGTASCDATVTIEGEEAVEAIQVDNFRPRFLTPLQDLVVQEGDDVTMHCVATGNPTPKLKWQKDMLEVSNSARVSVTSDREGGSTLTIRNVKASDAGLYLVRARSRSGRCQCTATLRVQGGSRRQSPSPQASQQRINQYCLSTSVKPRAMVETSPSFSFLLPPSLDVHEGEAMRLDCSVQGYPTPIVTWYKNYRGLMYGPRHRILFVGSLHTLHIPQTMALDSGDYIVKAHNTLGSAESVCTVRLLPPRTSPPDDSEPKAPPTPVPQPVRSAPFFTKTLPSIVEVCAGVNVRLDCILREGVRLMPWSPPDDTGQLPDATPDKAGHSQVSEQESDTQEMQTAKEHTEERRDSGAGQFYEPLPEEVEEEEGGSVTLTCTVSHPFAHITWLKDGDRLSFESERVGSIREEGGRVSLRVSEVQRSDAGLYRCVATLTDGSQLQFDSRLSVRELGETPSDKDTRQEPSEVDDMTSSADKDKPPVVVLQNKRQVVEEGQRAKFKVIVEGSSSPCTVTWSRKGKTLEAGPKFKMYEEDGGHCLEMCDVSTADRGTYVVSVSNESGTDTALVVLDVTEKEADVTPKRAHPPPALLAPLHDMNVVIGDRDVKLKCEVGVSEEAECRVRWYREGEEVGEGESKEYRCRWTGRSASLTIGQIASKHAGLYKCEISTAEGQVTTSCRLSVRVPEKLEPPFFIRELHDLEVEDGDKVQLVVEVEDTGLDTATRT